MYYNAVAKFLFHLTRLFFCFLLTLIFIIAKEYITHTFRSLQFIIHSTVYLLLSRESYSYLCLFTDISFFVFILLRSTRHQLITEHEFSEAKQGQNVNKTLIFK